MNTNRRQFPRFSFDHPVSCRTSMMSEASGALSRDISSGGIRMTVNEFMPIGSQLEMAIFLPALGREVQIKGRVAWIRENSYSERFDIGVSFIPDGEVDALKQVLKDKRTL